jgi:hypothetical protein
MRTMPRGQYHPVISEEVRKLEAECYASPEELLGREPTPASDIYSLGVLCVELFHNYTRIGEREEVGPSFCCEGFRGEFDRDSHGICCTWVGQIL